MDILSHGLWTNLVFKELPIEHRAWAISFGILPDLISFSFLAVKDSIKKTMHYKEQPLNIFPSYIFKLYNYTHSLVLWVGSFFILKIFGFDFAAVLFCGWGFHILLDIFTHTSNFFPTPILWPFSSFHFSGINWANRWFMIFNYSVLAFLYLVFYF